MAKVSWELFAEGFLPGKQSHFWWAEPIPLGAIPVVTALGTPRLGPHGFALPDRRFKIADLWFLTKPNGSLQLNFEVKNMEANGFPYQVYWSLITQ